MNARAKLTKQGWTRFRLGAEADTNGSEHHSVTDNPLAVKDQMQHARLLSRLISSQRQGRGCLPFCLGLMPVEFVWVVTQHFAECPTLNAILDVTLPANSVAVDKGRLRQDLLTLRQDEWVEIRDLLLSARAGKDSFELHLAAIVAAACLGGDHLWRDLGLGTRTELSELMQVYFPDLAWRNAADMKWKKFFYKQLCEQQGGYVCRAPSCDQCAAYDDCFGPED